MSLRLRASSAEETQKIAGVLASFVRPRDLLVLSGDLGGGKTTFVQGLAVAMGIIDWVTSPTFVLAQTYEAPVRLHHLDFYRLEKVEEVIDLNLPELLNDDAVVAIEWGERFLSELPTSHLVIRFNLGGGNESQEVRLLELQPSGDN